MKYRKSRRLRANTMIERRDVIRGLPGIRIGWMADFMPETTHAPRLLLVVRMRAPTQAPSQFSIHRSRVRKALAMVFALGAVMTAFGLSRPVFAVAPGEWTVQAVFEVVLAAVGLLLVVLTGLVAAWFARQEQPRPLHRRATLVIGTAAPAISTILVGLWYGTHQGAVTAPLEALGAVYLSQAALGLQLFFGSSEVDRRPRRLLGAGLATGITFVGAVLAVVSAMAAEPTLKAYLLGIAPSLGVFVGVGGLCYLLGYLLVRRPQYHHVP